MGVERCRPAAGYGSSATELDRGNVGWRQTGKSQEAGAVQAAASATSDRFLPVSAPSESSQAPSTSSPPLDSLVLSGGSLDPQLRMLLNQMQQAYEELGLVPAPIPLGVTEINAAGYGRHGAAKQGQDAASPSPRTTAQMRMRYAIAMARILLQRSEAAQLQTSQLQDAQKESSQA